MKPNIIVDYAVFEADLSDLQTAAVFESKISNIFEQQLMPIVENLMARYPTNRNIKIDCLSVDLGNINSQSWESDISISFQQQLDQILQSSSTFSAPSYQQQFEDAIAIPSNQLNKQSAEVIVRWLLNTNSVTSAAQLSNHLKAKQKLAYLLNLNPHRWLTWITDNALPINKLLRLHGLLNDSQWQRLYSDCLTHLSHHKMQLLNPFTEVWQTSTLKDNHYLQALFEVNVIYFGLSNDVLPLNTFVKHHLPSQQQSKLLIKSAKSAHDSLTDSSSNIDWFKRLSLCAKKRDATTLLQLWESIHLVAHGDLDTFIRHYHDKDTLLTWLSGHLTHQQICNLITQQQGQLAETLFTLAEIFSQTVRFNQQNNTISKNTIWQQLLTFHFRGAIQHEEFDYFSHLINSVSAQSTLSVSDIAGELEIGLLEHRVNSNCLDLLEQFKRSQTTKNNEGINNPVDLVNFERTKQKWLSILFSAEKTPLKKLQVQLQSQLNSVFNQKSMVFSLVKSAREEKQFNPQLPDQLIQQLTLLSLRHLYLLSESQAQQWMNDKSIKQKDQLDCLWNLLFFAGEPLKGPKQWKAFIKSNHYLVMPFPNTTSVKMPKEITPLCDPLTLNTQKAAELINKFKTTSNQSLNSWLPTLTEQQKLQLATNINQQKSTELYFLLLPLSQSLQIHLQANNAITDEMWLFIFENLSKDSNTPSSHIILTKFLNRVSASLQVNVNCLMSIVNQPSIRYCSEQINRYLKANTSTANKANELLAPSDDDFESLQTTSLTSKIKVVTLIDQLFLQSDARVRMSQLLSYFDKFPQYSVTRLQHYLALAENRYQFVDRYTSNEMLQFCQRVYFSNSPSQSPVQQLPSLTEIKKLLTSLTNNSVAYKQVWATFLEGLCFAKPESLSWHGSVKSLLLNIDTTTLERLKSAASNQPQLLNWVNKATNKRLQSQPNQLKETVGLLELIPQIKQAILQNGISQQVVELINLLLHKAPLLAEQTLHWLVVENSHVLSTGNAEDLAQLIRAYLTFLGNDETLANQQCKALFSQAQSSSDPKGTLKQVLKNLNNQRFHNPDFSYEVSDVENSDDEVLAYEANQPDLIADLLNQLLKQDIVKLQAWFRGIENQRLFCRWLALGNNITWFCQHCTDAQLLAILQCFNREAVFLGHELTTLLSTILVNHAGLSIENGRLASWQSLLTLFVIQHRSFSRFACVELFLKTIKEFAPRCYNLCYNSPNVLLDNVVIYHSHIELNPLPAVLDCLNQHLSQLALLTQQDNARDSSFSRNEQENELQNEQMKNVYLVNAGLVILHPFIPILFSKLELLKENQFVDEVAQHQAVNLLQGLVGSKSYVEADLFLNKLLCGLDPNEPVVIQPQRTKVEMEMIASMLQEVIRLWSSIGNTSISSLQTSFLQRPAYLILTENEWQLNVEKQAYDMLLDNLPWGMSLIKYSWMKMGIQIHWRS